MGGLLLTALLGRQRRVNMKTRVLLSLPRGIEHGYRGREKEENLGKVYSMLVEVQWLQVMSCVMADDFVNLTLDPKCRLFLS